MWYCGKNVEGSPLKVVLPVDTPPAKEAHRENSEVKTRVDEWLTSAQNKEEAENKPYKGDKENKELTNQILRPRIVPQNIKLH